MSRAGLKRRGRRWKRRTMRLRRQAGRLAAGLVAAALCLAGLALAVASASSEPPESSEDLCAIFEDRRSWYRATRRSFKKWGVPEAVQMSVIFQESGFRGRVRPPRKWYLRFIPGPRPSSAYGYAQALEGTWSAYEKSTGRTRARRDRFGDAADFVGWYGARIHRRTGVAKTDAFALYLAYHEGPGGYLRGTHERRPWLLRVARRVEARAGKYQLQYDTCRESLEKWWWVFW